jgi:Tfp pilus assembly protein PilW
MKRINKFIRGATLMEILVATAISTGVLGSAVGLYVKGTQGFYGEQAHSYMQFRTRTVLDRISTEARGASGFQNTATVNGTTYTASPGPSPAACMIIQVPSQDTFGLMYYGAGTATPNAMVNDTVVYYFSSADNTLRRTVAPKVSVVTNDAHSPRTSYRPSETGVVVARNVNRFTLVCKDNNGAVIASNPGASVAAIDITTQVLSTGAGTGESPVSVTGVRLRNMHGASIPGTVKRGTTAIANAAVNAVYTSPFGAYPSGTIVASATSSATGNFELSGLVEGTYSVTATPPTGTAATVTGINVTAETATASQAITVP